MARSRKQARPAITGDARGGGPSTDRAFPAGGGAMGARIRAYDWASTPLGPMERWPQSLRTVVDMIVHSAFPAAIVWGPNLVTIHNDAFRPILGSKPEALGRPFREVWSEAWHEIGPIAERALDGEPTFIEDFPLIVERKGYPEQAYFTFCYSPIRDEAGNVAGFLDTVVETTTKVLAERALRESEQRLRDIAANFPGVIIRRVTYPDGRVEYPFISDNAERVLGLPADGGQPVRAVEDLAKYVAPEDLARWWAAAQAAAATLEPLEIEGRFFAPDGRIRWVRSISRPHRRADGATVWDGVTLDVTAQKEAEEALREREQRLRLALDAGHLGEWDWDLKTDRATQSLRTYRVYGYDAPLPAFTYATFMRHVLPEDREAVNRTVREAISARRPLHVECRIRRVDGELRWIEVSGAPFREEAGPVARMIGVVADITERKQAEERRELLIQELNHRVKNALALVIGLASLTRRRSNSLEAFAEAFEGRLRSLAGAYSLLAQGEWARTDLRQLVALSLAPYRRGEADTVAIDGPDVELTASAALPLHMILHELTTNAAKYGALSASGGRVEVRWAVEPAEGDGRRLRLCWRESGGPAVAPPTRRGMGTSLIERSADYELGGEAEIAFRPDGLRCTLTIPLPGNGQARPK